MLRIIWVITNVCFFVLATNVGIAETKDDEPDKMLLRVESGGSVHFPINSMRKYEEGMSFENWTRLAVNFSDIINDDAEWELQVRAMSGVIIGDYDFDLPLDYLFVKIENFSGNLGAGGQVQESFIELTTDFQTLISGATQGNFHENRIHISYQLGNDSDEQLKGKPFGYYYVDLQFCLRKNGDPGGCEMIID